MIFYPQMLDSGRFQEVSGGFRFQDSGFKFQKVSGFRIQDSRGNILIMIWKYVALTLIR